MLSNIVPRKIIEKYLIYEVIKTQKEKNILNLAGIRELLHRFKSIKADQIK